MTSSCAMVLVVMARAVQVVGLTSLQVLHLNDNRLKHLPTRFLGSLISLTHLQLQYNALQYLPVQLGELPSLQQLQLEGNPLQHAPLQQLAEAGAATGEGVDLGRLRQQLPLQPQPQASPSASRPGSTAPAVRPSASRGSGAPIPDRDTAPRGVLSGSGAAGQMPGQGATAPLNAQARCAAGSVSEGQGPAQQGGGAKAGDGAGTGGTSGRVKPAIDILVIDETGPTTAPVRGLGGAGGFAVQAVRECAARSSSGTWGNYLICTSQSVAGVGAWTCTPCSRAACC